MNVDVRINMGIFERVFNFHGFNIPMLKEKPHSLGILTFGGSFLCWQYALATRKRLWPSDARPKRF